MVSILVIPDSHCKPGVENDRYDWAARFAIDFKPDYIVELGDFVDNASLCSYTIGKKANENKRLTEDISHAIEARHRLTQPILDEQGRLAKGKKRKWNVKLFALGGNHENRILKLQENLPHLDGLLPEDLSNSKEFGWDYYPFGEIITIENIDFSHYFKAKGRQNPLAGKNLPHRLVQERKRSSVQGHSHLWGYYTERNEVGGSLCALVAGCYFDHWEGYAGNDNNMWWRGLTLLTNVENGHFDVQQYSYNEIKHAYGVL
jgi:hypothetical protein